MSLELREKRQLPFGYFAEILCDDRNCEIVIKEKNVEYPFGQIVSSGKFEINFENYPYISCIRTRVGHERLGLASFIIRMLCDLAKNQGHKKVNLSCRKEMVPFYEKLDFRINSIRENIASLSIEF